MTKDQIKQSLKKIQYPAFLFLDTFESTSIEIKELIKELSSSSYYPQSWINCAIELCFWLTTYYSYFSPRNYLNHMIYLEDSKFENLVEIKSRELLSDNPKHAFLILENLRITNKNDRGKGRVINITEFPIDDYLLCKINGISLEYVHQITLLYSSLKNIANNWLEVTNSEFILDPNYYNLKGKKKNE